MPNPIHPSVSTCKASSISCESCRTFQKIEYFPPSTLMVDSYLPSMKLVSFSAGAAKIGIRSVCLEQESHLWQSERQRLQKGKSSVFLPQQSGNAGGARQSRHENCLLQCPH